MLAPEPLALLDRALRQIRFPARIARRWTVCARVRRDPTDHCPRCGL